MRSTQLLKMQPGRALQTQGLRTLRAQMTPMLRMRLQAPSKEAPHARMLHVSAPMMKEKLKEEHSAHTISQRLRSIKKIPVELVPLVLVMIVAIAAAIFSLGKKIYTDKQLRLTRQGTIKIPKSQQKPAE